MIDVFDAMMELNKRMLLEGMDSTYDLHLSNFDFEKLALFLLEKNEKWIKFDTKLSIATIKQFQVAGPGGYITVYRK